MRIVGLGSDIVECLRIRRMIEEHGEQFLLRVFTAKEIRTCQAKRHTTEHFAARWAAKEAVLRSLGTSGKKSTIWTDIETDLGEAGNTIVLIVGGLRELMDRRGANDVLVTHAFCRAYATATALAIANG